ncbi:MAG TPA: penicillin acylase family protein, partial [Gemmatimonadaceae bacterium]
SYSRIKARNYREFKKIMDLHTNSSNNTIFADAEGNVAYFHANFIPKRDTSFDWRKPVDGSNPATEWKGLHTVDESPLVLNPPNGWVYNTNNWPYSAAGPNSPQPRNFPKYMDNGSESPRGLHALRVLSARKQFTPQDVIDAAFDTWLPSFDVLVPSLIAAYDASTTADSLKQRVKEQIALLRAWDHRWSATSVPTTLALFWGDELLRTLPAARASWTPSDTLLANGTTGEAKLRALATASDRLVTDYGTWKTPWGDVNRFQRLTGDIVQPFSDAAPSIPIGFTSSRWGSLAAFGARPANGTKKYYGTSGNSFLAVVEFGDSVRARAVSAGGESGHSASKHFNDQADRYATGNLRNVYFYRSQLAGHTERQYHPGQ